MKKLLLILMALFLWAGISWAQDAKIKQKDSNGPVNLSVFQSIDEGQNEMINTSTVSIDPSPDQVIYQNNTGFNPKSPMVTTLIDPTGDGGFANGATFALNGWTSSNSANNPWVIGTYVSTAPFAGNSAYVSNDAGLTNNYTNTLPTLNYFYRDVTIPAGETKIILSFNWVCNGESTWDAIQVFAAPTSITPVGTTTYPGSGLSLVPAGIAGATFIGSANLQATIQSATFAIPPAFAGTTVRLIFAWKSDTSGGTNPGGSIDNISLISSLPLSIISSTFGGLWNSPATWVGGIVPLSDNVTIAAGADVVVNQSILISDLTVDGTLQWITTTTPSGTVNTLQAQNITISGIGKLLAHGAVANGAAVMVTGNFTNNGIANFAAPSALLIFNGTSGTQTLGGMGTFIDDTQGRGMIRQLFFTSLAACDISPTLPQNLVTGNLAITGNSLNTNGKLSIDNTAISFGGLINRSIYTVTVNNMGSGYTSAPTVTFTAAPAGGTTATGVANYDAGTGTIRSITITNAGDGYRVAPTFTFLGGGGTGLAAVAALYQNLSTTVIAQSQKSAIATITGGININSSQGVGSVFVTNGGTGYTSAPVVGFALPVSFINLVTAGGSGYTSAPTVGFVGGGGSGAIGTAIVCRGQVVSVHITTAGTNYTSVPAITLTGGGGTGASAAIPASMLPTATANIDLALGMVTSFTVTNPGYGYLTTFPVVTLTGGTLGTAASGATSRHGLYNMIYNYFLPATSNPVHAESAVVPANRRIHAFTIANALGASFIGDLTLYGLAPLPTSSFMGDLNMGGNTLTFEHPSYTGYAGTAYNYVSNGNITYRLLGSTLAQTRPFMFNSYDAISGLNNHLLSMGSATTVATEGSTITTLTGSVGAAPTGINMIGTRTLRIQTNGLYGNLPTLRMDWNSVDALVADAALLTIAQATATSGPWTIRSVASGAGMINPAGGNRTTATTAPGPIAITGDDYFGWNYVAPACPQPINLTANNILTTSANLAWSPGGSETAWEYSYGISPYPTPPAGTIYPSTDNTTNSISPLTSATTYQYYVRSNCGGGVYSTWAGPYTFTTLICPPANQCSYTFRMTDSYGDGWNGNTMAVKQSGITLQTIGSTFTTGYGPIDVLVPLCDGLAFELFWNSGGSYATEVGIAILDPFGNTVYYKAPGTGAQNTLLYTGTVNCTPPALVDWCNLQWPPSGSISLGGNYTVYAQVWEPGVTDAAGQGAGITAWIGYSTTNTNPNTWAPANWVPAIYNVDVGNNDEYMADLGLAITNAGTYYYASRFELNSAGSYKYGGYNAGGGGFWDGTANVSGVLTITLANDACSGAITIACGNPYTGTTIGATIDAPGACNAANYTYPGVWYHFVGIGDMVSVDLCTGTTWDSQISVYSGSCGSLVCVDGNDDYCALQSRVDWFAENGVDYYILVHQYGSTGGAFTITVNCTYPTTATWQGDDSSPSAIDWFGADNWDVADVPGSTTNVIIPTGLTNYPTVDRKGACNDISVASGARLVDQGTGNLIPGGTATVDQNYLGGEWHLISSPVSGATANMFLGLYLQKHTESTNAYTDIYNTSTPLNIMQGYALWNDLAGTASFVGTLNTGDIGSANNVTRSGQGWNLVGNPYASPIDWNAVTGWTKTNVDNATYRHVNNATWASYVGGVGANGGTQYIAPNQGFFVGVTSGFTLGTLSMTNAVRTHSTAPFFKDEIADIVRLEVTGNGYTDETVIRFLDVATPEFDGDWDAHKLFGIVPEAAAIYSTDNDMMAINSLPASNTVTVGVKAGVPGEFTITATETSEFADVILEDLMTGTITDLKSNSYTFIYDMNFDNRFIVHFTPLAVGENPADMINIYSSQKDVYVSVPANTEGDIVVYNLMGQEVARTVITDVVNKITLEKSAYYVVKVMSNESVVTEKVFVK